jgi:hypothetical protein
MNSGLLHWPIAVHAERASRQRRTQIAVASWRNAMASRRPAGSSVAIS